jgi:hypothetical protein
MRSVIALVHAERGVDRGDHPVELGQQLVAVVERAVGEDVRLGADSTLEVVERALSARTSSIAPLQRVGVTWLPKPCEAEWSVIARYSSRARARPRPSPRALAAVGERRVAVHVAAQVVELDESRKPGHRRRRPELAAALAQLGRIQASPSVA